MKVLEIKKIKNFIKYNDKNSTYDYSNIKKRK
jgi:hypothetical protein